MKFDSTINLRLTQKSGQTSQSPWKEKDGRYYDMIYIDGMPVIIKAFQDDISSLNIDFEFSSSECYSYESIGKVAIEKEVARIFDLNFDLDKFYEYLSEDSRLIGAIDFCRGLRLFLAKDPFETIVSSIVSANNSIVRWTKSITKIRELWGTSVDFLSGTFYSFPSPSLLMSVYEDDFGEYKARESESCMKNLKACGVGYRAHYIKKTSELLALDEDLFEISNMKYNEAFERVLSFPGVGPKVADCILLYGFGFKEAFPTDVWIKRIVSHLYFNDKDISVDKIRDFGMEQFGDYAGYVQLYLFHYARKSGIMKKLK
jgi:N-glycosylase/DNA lyase